MSNDIKYVYHLADIHIRPLDRHDEYKYVFENLYKKILLDSKAKRKQSIIVISGDIFHTRDKLLSETIILFDNLIENLVKLVDHVFMIPGNHDSFKSSNRLDTISGITQIKKFPRFTLFTETQIYRYKNLNIIANCLTDSKNKFITY